MAGNKSGGYVLVDFENVQPRNLELLAERPFEVRVFVGANQTKVPVALAAAMAIWNKFSAHRLMSLSATCNNILPAKLFAFSSKPLMCVFRVATTVFSRAI